MSEHNKVQHQKDRINRLKAQHDKQISEQMNELERIEKSEEKKKPKDWSNNGNTWSNNGKDWSNTSSNWSEWVDGVLGKDKDGEASMGSTIQPPKVLQKSTSDDEEPPKVLNKSILQHNEADNKGPESSFGMGSSLGNESDDDLGYGFADVFGNDFGDGNVTPKDGDTTPKDPPATQGNLRSSLPRSSLATQGILRSSLPRGTIARFSRIKSVGPYAQSKAMPRRGSMSSVLSGGQGETVSELFQNDGNNKKTVQWQQPPEDNDIQTTGGKMQSGKEEQAEVKCPHCQGLISVEVKPL